MKLIPTSLSSQLLQSIKGYWDHKSLTNYNATTLYYKDVAKYIKVIHKLFNSLGIKHGDKIMLLDNNSAEWCICYLATVTYGATIVPVLPEFSADNINTIIEHSDSKILFTRKSFFDKINSEQFSNLFAVFDIQTQDVIYENFPSPIQDLVEDARNIDVTQESFDLEIIPEESIAVISYTSGTSGTSKGVMLSHRSIGSNIYAIEDYDFRKSTEGKNIVSFLPLSHAYGCLFEFLMPFVIGCHITIINHVPTPQTVTEAYNKYSPALILSVPLVLEKIYQRYISPVLKKPLIKIALRIPIIKGIIQRKFKEKLLGVFGGEVTQVILGGAALNPEVEKFFLDIKFPITIGYGMTECGPLISYSNAPDYKRGSTGVVVPRLQCKIDSKDPHNIPGEILIKGDKVMDGYYKEEALTAEVFTPDGWLKTGDLGVIDSDNTIYIRGRSKNMILAANGQNIFPEEIEALINALDYVQEAIVRGNNGRVEALVYPNFDLTKTKALTHDALIAKVEDIGKTLSGSLPKYAQISKVIVMEEEFEKTPKKSIKRYLYNIEK